MLIDWLEQRETRELTEVDDFNWDDEIEFRGRGDSAAARQDSGKDRPFLGARASAPDHLSGTGTAAVSAANHE